MEMHQVRYFLAVARTLNFTRAAEESNVTQPSLTRAIQKLEEEFGGLLFRRERALTHLTDLGKLMLPHLERTYEAAQTAKSLAKGVGKATVAPLALGLAAALRRPEVGETLRDVAAQLPGLQLKLVAGEPKHLLEDLLKGELDILVLPAPAVLPERVNAAPLFDQRYALAVPYDHQLARAQQAAVDDLGEAALIDDGSELLAELRAPCERCSTQPLLRHEANGEDHILRLVAAGLGCGVVGSDAAPAAGTVLVEFTDLPLVRTIMLASVSGRQRSAAADAFLRSARARAWS